MSSEIVAEILKAVSPRPCGVRELAKKLNHRPKTVISLVKEMEEQGLIERKVEKRKVRGRPRYLIKPSILGEDYFTTYRKLELKKLRSRRTDLIRATRDAKYVKRLVARGQSPFHLFLELNSIGVFNNKGST